MKREVPLYQHTFENNILGVLTFTRSWRFTFVYPDGTREIFPGVRKLTAMRTGCYVLAFDYDHHVVVVAPGHRYVIEEPM